MLEKLSDEHNIVTPFKDWDSTAKAVFVIQNIFFLVAAVFGALVAALVTWAGVLVVIVSLLGWFLTNLAAITSYTEKR